MKDYLDGIGRAIPRVLDVAAQYELRGNPDCLLLYGYYEWGNSSWWRKVLQGVRNGAGLRHQHKGKGTRSSG
jgi:hypothetical protein